MNLFLISILIIGSQFLISCATNSVGENPAENPQKPAERIVGSWEDTTAPHPERKAWTDVLADYYRANLESHNKAQDIADFCPKYHSIDNEKKVKAWIELIIAVTYYESGYKPTSRMIETTMGTDPYTGRQVASEGLLQLSYQDVEWARYCQFDWSIDKKYSDNDPRKSIFDPKKNLSCGVRILNRQIKNKGKIALSSGVYWAVLKINGKYTKIPEIKARVLKYAPECGGK